MLAKDFLTEQIPTQDGWQQQGTGTLTWSVFSVYRATLWTAGVLQLDAHEPANPQIAIEFAYLRNVSADSIVEASEREIKRLTAASAQQVADWCAALRELMPDVGRGDLLWMIFEKGRAIHFWQGERLLGVIQDGALANAMMHVWFHPECHSQRLRLQLLKEV